MKLKLLIPALLTTGLLLLAGIYLFRTNTQKLPPSEVIQRTMQAQGALAAERPEDRVYACLDKPFYAPGETVWFSAFVRDAASLGVSQKSGILRAELINPKGMVEMEYKIPVDKAGVAKGDFRLPKDLPGGQYIFQAYTLWQTNDENPAIFRKEIQVQKVILPKLKMDFDFTSEAYAPGDKVEADVQLTSNSRQTLAHQAFSYEIKYEGSKLKSFTGKTDADGTARIQFQLPENLESRDVLVNLSLDYQGSRESIARTVPVLLDKVQMEFYPEGGDMVAGLTSKVAFKVRTTSGDAVDVEGIIMDSKGQEITDFASLNQGIGTFHLKPDAHERYKAAITFPSHISQTFDLPKALSSGYTLTVEQTSSEAIALAVGATTEGEVSLMASVRGKNYFSQGLKLKPGQNKINIPLDGFPMGVAQITLFDPAGIARAERLAFVRTDKQLDIKVETDKEAYLPREKVKMSIQVQDASGKGLPTDLAVAVVDDQLLSFADDHSSHLLSWMLLEADLDTKLERPDFYFDENEADAQKAMDQVLLTSGWRRFSWKQLAENDFPKIEQRAERMVLAGTILDNEGKPLLQAKVQVLGQDKTQLAKDGFFEIDGVDLTREPVRVAISAPGHFRQEQLVGDYGQFEYQLFARDLGEGLEINERANRLAQSQQLGLANDEASIASLTVRKPIGPSVFTQSQMQVVNFRNQGDRWDDANATDASTFQAREFEAGIQYDLDDNRVRQLQNEDAKDKNTEGAYLSDVAFYRVREFPVKQYQSTQIDQRKDFRSTVYWNGHLQTDEDGKAQITFWNSDAVTSFNITAEGMSADGQIGRAERQFHTEMPFSISAKIPVEVTVGDVFEIPITLVNNTKQTIAGQLAIAHPGHIEALNEVSGSVSLTAGESRVFLQKYKVRPNAIQGDLDELSIGFHNRLFQDHITQEITVVPRGFPTRVAYSGTNKETEYQIEIRELEEHSLEVELEAYPNALAELVEGMDGMMKKPYGCFEQSSSCNYPNILALQYLRKTEQSNPKVERQARELLAYGHERIKGFESPNGGFEWFGGPVGHEGITAFAIMQFTHMKKVYKGVDQGMIDRSVAWLKGRRDGKGGFLRNERSTWSLGLDGDASTFNAYIVYCLSEAQVDGFDKELARVYESAKESANPYLVGIAALAHHNYGLDRKAQELTTRQDQLVASSGTMASNDPQTVFGGRGQNFEMEAKSLLVLNLAQQKPLQKPRIQELCKEIRQARKWDSSFGPTHTTVLGLRALLVDAEVSRTTSEDGTIAFYVRGQRVASQKYAAGEDGTIAMKGLERFFAEGQHDFKVVFEGVENPLPHTVSFRWNTLRPASSKEKIYAMRTHIPQQDIRVGDQVRMEVEVENTTSRNQPTPMAIVGIPAGLSPQVRQLNELVEQGKMDYYELSGNNIILYFRNIRQGETKDIPLDLKAEIAGDFKAQASSAYSFYNEQDKLWMDGVELSIVN